MSLRRILPTQDVAALAAHVLPPVVCHIATAALAITPHTRTLRRALCPLAALLALRAALSLDERHLGVNMTLVLTIVALRSLSWTWAEKPLVRPAHRSPSVMADALDLVTNLRGHGWEWSRGLHVPRDTRPTHRVPFAVYALLSAVAHALIGGGFHVATLAFATPLGPTSGGTIFDHTLPAAVRYLRSSLITIMAGLTTSNGTQMLYDLFTVPGVLLFGQDPARWPPVFDSPWRATSLGDFWGRRWHQTYRHTFLLCAHPLSVVLGRAGGVLGAFLSSALLHHLLLVSLDRRSEPWRMLVGFGMMGPGVLAERAFYRWTGRRVGGAAGWVWTMAWLLVLGNVMVDGFMRAGMFSLPSAVDGLTPVRVWIENAVSDVDAWLHTPARSPM